MTLSDLFSRARQFSLPPFDLVPLEFEAEAETDELVLDAIVAGLGGGSPVVRLIRPMPTAGELQAKIDRHLKGAEHPGPPVDAAEELRNALAALRRSIG